MEQWSILSNIMNYVQYDRYPSNFHNVIIKAVNKANHKRKPNTEDERQMLELDFGDIPGKLKRRIFRYMQWNSIRDIKHPLDLTRT